MDQIIVEMAGTATIAIALFGIAFGLAGVKNSSANKSFALFLGVVAVNSFPDAFARILENLPVSYIQVAELILWTPSLLFIAPLFWVYVFVLTSPEQRIPKRFYLHFLLPLVAILNGLIVLLFLPEARAFLFFSSPLPSSTLSMVFATIVAVSHLSIYPQVAIYLFLIVRRLIRFRSKLRDIYASTEEYEMRWIFTIGGLGLLYWLARSLFLLTAFDPERAGVNSLFVGVTSIAGLVLVAAMTLFGLRQHPPLVPPDIEEEQTRGTSNDREGEPVSEKYEKSALSAEASARISRKLRAAMDRDHLHRNPNLSLWTLARHIGASPNHVSQALNEEIGESFFDFVNGYRIAEATTLMSTTNDSILKITYDVGFNARSTFYKAFKRVTGQTPTNYRKTVSLPVGMSDINK